MLGLEQSLKRKQSWSNRFQTIIMLTNFLQSMQQSSDDFLIWFRFDSTTEAIGYPQRLKALWVNYDDAELIFTEIRFKLSDESSSILTASGYIKKDRFKVLLKCHDQKFNWI